MRHTIFYNSRYTFHIFEANTKSCWVYSKNPTCLPKLTTFIYIIQKDDPNGGFTFSVKLGKGWRKKKGLIC